MPFKIVQTKEKSGILLSIVPDRWELDGVLKWPQHGKIKPTSLASMQRDEKSVPANDWMELKCRLKRQCATYEDALRQTREMSEASDTDGTDHSMPPPTLLPKKRNMVNRNTIGRQPASDSYSGMVCIAINYNFSCENVSILLKFGVFYSCHN